MLTGHIECANLEGAFTAKVPQKYWNDPDCDGEEWDDVEPMVCVPRPKKPALSCCFFGKEGRGHESRNSTASSDQGREVLIIRCYSFGNGEIGTKFCAFGELPKESL